MSSVPDGAVSAQAYALALTLTSYQRTILAKAGEPRWFDLPHPWLPMPGSQESTARSLAEGQDALLASVTSYLGAYELTPFGEQVAAVFLLRLVAPDAGVDLARRLTPIQRSVLGQVAVRGECWAGALSTREGYVADALVSAEYEVLDVLGTGSQRTYTLTPLGVQVLHLLAEEVEA
jgi:hypothetical protein